MTYQELYELYHDWQVSSVVQPKRDEYCWTMHPKYKYELAKLTTSFGRPVYYEMCTQRADEDMLLGLPVIVCLNRDKPEIVRKPE